MFRSFNISNNKLKVTLSYKDICNLKDFFIIGPFDSYVTDKVITQLDIIIKDMNQNDYDSVQWESEV